MVFHKFIEKYLLVFYRIYGDSSKKEARSGGGETTPATGTERHPAVVVRFCIAGRGLVHTGIRRLLFHLLEQRPGCRQVRAGVRCDAGSGEQLGWQVGCGNGELYRRRMVRPLRDLHPDRADRPFSGRSRSAIFSEMHGAFSEPGSVVRTGSMSPDGLIRSSAYWAPDCCWHWLS